MAKGDLQYIDNSILYPTLNTVGLPHWKKWCHHVKQLSKKEQKEDQIRIARIARANARIRLASSFQGIILEDYSETSKNGYDAVLRLLLCYSAAEEVGVAIGTPVTRWRMLHIVLAPKLRALFKNAQSRTGSAEEDLLDYKPLMENISKSLKNKLTEFQADKTDDTRIAATVLRHLIAHGSLTLNSLQIRSKTSVDTINALSNELLFHAKKNFQTWLYCHNIIKEKDRD